MKLLIYLFVLAILAVPELSGAEADALAISANIRARHMPFGTILDPIYSSASSTQIVGYTRCGDSALWTGAYLAAESFRYNVTRSPQALDNVRFAIAGLKGLTDVTGDNQLARCLVTADSPYAAGIASEEASNNVSSNPPWIWIGNTSRDQIVGAFFGLGIAFDLVDDPGVKATASDVVTRLIGYISRHQWSPDDSFTTSFQLRPEGLQMLLQVARHVNPANTVSGPFFVPPVQSAVLVDVQGNGSYFKFNLDYMSLYHLIRLQDNGPNRDAYSIVRNYTAGHQNPFFNLIDRALNAPDATRDAETRSLLDQWLQRSNRDFFVDASKTVRVCGVESCLPIPVPARPPTDFLWQRDPFQLAGGGNGFIESAGIDYILPYWMARYLAVIKPDQVQPAAGPGTAVAPGSLASIFASGLSTATAQAGSLPLPTVLGGITLVVTDAAGTSRTAPLQYVSPGQINFIVPEGSAAGAAKFTTGAQTIPGVIDTVAPALFSMNGTGSGVAAATAIQTQVSNPNLQGPLTVFQCTAGRCTSVPIRLGVDTPIYVTFYGTGIKNRSALANVSVTINGISVPVLYAGASPNFPGLDQVNVGLTLGLRNSGESNVVLTVDGRKSNTVTINVQ